MQGLRLLVLLVSLAHAPALWAQAIGVFAQVEGEVHLLRGDNVLVAERGVELQSADIVATTEQASTQLDMEDGSILKLGPATRLVLAEYKLDADKSVIASTLDLLSGWMRFAVAKLRPTGSYAMNTPSLTIGVRGTEGTIAADSAQAALDLHEGAVDVRPFGGDRAVSQSLHVTGGQYVARRVGQDFTRHARAPAGFTQRVPPGMQRKLARQSLPPKVRGTSPRVLRAMTPQDRQRFLKEHPQFKQRLEPRFGPKTQQSGAAQRTQQQRARTGVTPRSGHSGTPNARPPQANSRYRAPGPNNQPRANQAPQRAEKNPPKRTTAAEGGDGPRERSNAPHRAGASR